MFSDEQRTAYYLEIEAALARVQGRLGIIPAEAAREIESKCRVENIDFAKLKATTERIGYPILGVVQQIVALCDKGLGEWCHWGATTQDITDTATVMQIRAALDLVEADMEKIAAALADLARRYRDTPMAGRSNLQQAVPITFGFKAASLLAAMQRHRERLDATAPARAGRRVRGRRRHAVVARRRRPQGAGGADGRARPRAAGDRLAYGARPHRRSRLLSRPRHRHARQDRRWT